MKPFLAFLCCLLAVAQLTTAQTIKTRYIVQFRNKGTNPYSLANPTAYVSQRAVDRRTRYGIVIDSTDLPVTPRYVDSLRNAGAVTILNVSKWLNSVTIRTSDAAALSKINSFPFVSAVSAIASRPVRPGKQPDTLPAGRDAGILSPLRTTGVEDFFSYGSSFGQVHIHNGEFLHNIGLRGQGLVIGILDAGFNNYLGVHAFDSARANGQILGTWDFVTGDASVNEDDAHGMECFSIIASNMPGQLVGSAPKANYYLFRSEDASTEYPIEEHNWVCAAERLDSAGGDLISSSLGYGDQMSDPIFNHTYAQLDGKTTMNAIGAGLAAKKGLLVVCAAGNEGTSSWHYILTPADADSVMAVGAVDINGNVANFSSYGPTADGRIKPDVASVGVNTFIETPGNVVSSGNGTSFATPNIAGLTTCLWQGFPEFNNMKVINALRLSGNMASAPNNRVGYGIPDVKKAMLILLKSFATASASISNCTTTLTWTSKDASTMKYEIERKLPGQTAFVKVGEKYGTGSIFSTHTGYQYQEALNAVQAGAISYRIREIIDTSVAGFSADYLDTVTVSLAAACTTTGIDPVNLAVEEISLLPNPAHDRFTLTITSAAPVRNLVIRLTNARGQLVALFRKNKAAGSASFDIPVATFARGKYFVTLYDDQKIIATKELLKL